MNLGLFDDDDEERRRIRALGGEGILRPEDLDTFTASKRRVLDLMLTGFSETGFPCGWHESQRIRAVAGDEGPASEGLRRMRELRAAGFTVERKHVSGRTWAYRIAGKREA